MGADQRYETRVAEATLRSAKSESARVGWGENAGNRRTAGEEALEEESADLGEV
jgi:hypothetical protein